MLKMNLLAFLGLVLYPWLMLQVFKSMKQLIQWKVLPLSGCTPTVTSGTLLQRPFGFISGTWLPTPHEETPLILLVMVQSLHKQKLSWFPFAKTARGQP